MVARVLVTGAAGLLGSQVLQELPGCLGLDLRPTSQDGRAIELVADFRKLQTLPEVQGIVHLAGVSRVIDAQRDAATCWQSNVDGFADLLRLMAAMADPPWLMYSSSREVYGEAMRLPVDESAPLEPINVYGQSKVAAEALARKYATATGRPAQILRFSNVYGHPRDHATRVVPAFIRAALEGKPIEIQGARHLFDFTHVDDAARAVSRAAAAAEAGRQLPAMHVLPGVASSLDDLAACVAEATGAQISVRRTPGRPFDVARFRGDPALMQRELGMSCRIGLSQGVGMLARRFREELLCA